MLRFIVGFATGIVRASQRAPAVATGAMLIALTTAIAATSFPSAEPLVVGGLVELIRLTDALPFVTIEPYWSDAEDGTVTFSSDGDENAAGILQDVLLPFYGYLTGALALFRWVTRARPSRTGFWARFQPTVLLAIVCLVVFAASALQDHELISISPVFGVFVVIALLAATWSSLIGGALDAMERRLFPNAYQA